jgi:tRNA(fMet)-specific endonuclease VapC
LTLKYLLDTGTVSAPIAPKPSRVVLDRLGRRQEQCALAAIVWDELTYGCARLPPGKRKQQLQAYLDDVVHKSFPILPYDEEAAHWHGIERAHQERAGTVKPYVDGQIAAIARVNGLIVVTTNVRHFRGFRDLVVEDWTQAKAR